MPANPAEASRERLLLRFGTFAFGALIGKFSADFSADFVSQALAQTLPMNFFSNHIIIC
ncbi:MAG: hypothetical protein KatS3mg067_1755 [Thermosynechococcus sp.]|uniref:hypothetical protein n=1 Tax=Thermosynechococcus sp. TaxID=2814275 RepID=UPI002201A413|nr:hypothetical protein [Thermosynechococcus sp.]BCX12817.1 MAG: hypothetical protein KatS3mg067_1755 [Thermosynechococcus sp.]